MILTYRYRLKATSGAAQELSRQARAVNLVWNFCGETQETARRWNRRWPSGFDPQFIDAHGEYKIQALILTATFVLTVALDRHSLCTGRIRRRAAAPQAVRPCG